MGVCFTSLTSAEQKTRHPKTSLDTYYRTPQSTSLAPISTTLAVYQASLLLQPKMLSSSQHVCWEELRAKHLGLPQLIHSLCPTLTNKHTSQR